MQLYHRMISLIQCLWGKEPHTTLLNVKHLAGTLAAILVITLPSSRHVGGGNQLQTRVVSWFRGSQLLWCTPVQESSGNPPLRLELEGGV